MSPSYHPNQTWWVDQVYNATTTSQESAPYNGGTVGEVEQFSPYFYQPTVWLVAVAAVAFVFVTIAHVWLFFHGKAWFFWAMIAGALMEAAGFIFRTISARDLNSAYPFLVQYLALLLAPSFIAAACYVVFGRIIWWVTPTAERTFATLWCPPRFITLLFVAFDLMSFFIQLMGASSCARAIQDETLSTQEKSDRREKGLFTMRVGLVLQLTCFLFFAIIGARFVIISRRWAGRPLRHGPSHVRWERLNWTVNVATTLILIRTIYRIFEFTSGDGAPGYVVSHEWLFWALDGVPILLALVGLAVFHPTRYLPTEFCGFRLDRKRLSKVEKSSPPSYSLACTGI